MPLEPKLEGGRLKGTASTAQGLFDVIEKFSKLMAYPVKFTVDEIGSTMDYKSVFWIWMNAIAKQMTARGRKTTAEEMHDIFCHRHLGYTEKRIIGRTEIKPALRTLTYPKQLTRGEFYDLMRDIEASCQDWGITLPEKDSEYSQDKAREEA